MRRIEIPDFTPEEVELQRDIICAYIDRERDVWLEARSLADRAIGLDANLNERREKAMQRINSMLEELIEVPGVRSV